MNLCSAWLQYWGLRLGLRRAEAAHARLGEVLDLMAAHAIASGTAREKQDHSGFFEAMRYR